MYILGITDSKIEQKENEGTRRMWIKPECFIMLIFKKDAKNVWNQLQLFCPDKLIITIQTL